MAPAVAGSQSTWTWTRPTVYVVDDDPLVTQSLGLALSLETDWQVRTHNDAPSALEAMQSAPPEVVLSDLKMPRMDGIAFLKTVRTLYPDAVRILLTGYADKESAIAAINEVGLWQYVEKPWDLADLVHTVGQGLERKALVQRLERANAELSARVDELSRTREQLLASERLAAVGRVMAGVAHELSNQLGLLGFAELIVEQSTQPEVQGHARSILSAQQRLLRLGDEITDYSRAQAGLGGSGTAVAAVREPFDVAEVVEEMVRLLGLDRDVRACELSVEIKARPRAVLHRGKLGQALINLVRNAALASPRGGTIRVLIVQSADGGTDLRIVDDGCGMSPEVLARIGEPFFSTREGGTGLGVGITRRIVEEHQGQLQYSSTVGQGPEVRITLPPIAPDTASLA